MRLYTYAASANCLKVRVLLGLLGVAHDRTEVALFGGDTLIDAFARLNPLRETPVLELDDGGALTQSNAILVFLADGTLWGGTSALERGRIASWLSFEQERVMPGIGGTRFRALTGRATADELETRRRGGRHTLDVLEAHLTEREYLVASVPTIADLSVWAYTHVADDAGLALEQWPAVRAWVRRVGAIEGLVNDLEPYGVDARPGAGRSIYDD